MSAISIAAKGCCRPGPLQDTRVSASLLEKILSSAAIKGTLRLLSAFYSQQNATKNLLDGLRLGSLLVQARTVQLKLSDGMLNFSRLQLPN